jgi:hypothetical protein
MSKGENNVTDIEDAKGEEKQQPMIAVVPVPIEVYQEMYELLDEYIPRKKTKLLFRHLDQLQPQQVPVKG